jgi:hypothetical protein
MTLEQTMKCVWRTLAEDPNSTTFEDVDRTGESHRLYRCRYGCDGINNICNYYQRLKIK